MGGNRLGGSNGVVPNEPDGPDTTRGGDAPEKIDTEEAGGRTPEQRAHQKNQPL